MNIMNSEETDRGAKAREEIYTPFEETARLSVLGMNLFGPPTP